MKKQAMALAVAAATLGFATANAQVVDKPRLEVIKIIGSKDDARQLAGSGAVIDERQIEVEVPTDINQLLKTVPGVYIREEDGFGLRPNIGIRGATSERSSKISLLEDGVMVAPAPYADPAAYYFPTTLRVSSIEVLKGAPLLRYGPQTTGGFVNLLSTPIPDELGGKLQAVLGEYNSRDIHAHVGGTGGGFGWLVETAQRDSDGYKDIDRSSRDSGYAIEDYVVKLGWEGEHQSLLFKGQYSEEVSDETYLGLTDADFDRDVTRRYGLSEIDQMTNRHKGFSLVYSVDLHDRVTATASAYRNDFTRDWFKLDGGNTYIARANAGDAAAQAILDGAADVAGLRYKHNNRAYESKGIEVNVAVDLDSHQLNIGVRDHEDEVDRYQPVEIYDQLGGELVYQRVVLPGSGDNRVEQSEALTFWVTDSWQLTEALNLNLALRHEDVDSAGVRYGNIQRATVASRSANSTEEWLPGASFTYDLDDNWQLLAGVHRGFSPLGGAAREFEEPETSVNYEAGARYAMGELFVEAIAFYSDFDNKSENCSVARPCSNGDTSGTFTTGEAIIEGLEVQAGSLFNAGSLVIPVNLAYTYTQAEISHDNPTNGFEKGDDLADVPKHALSVRVGIESDMGWNNYAVAKYLDDMCVEVGCNRSGGRLARTESLFVVDLISRYSLSPATVVFLKMENLLDVEAIVSRVPDGARPNKPRTASLGVEFSF